MNSLIVKEFYLENRRLLKLENLTGELGNENIITSNEIHRPGLALSGFINIFSYDRIQVLGNTEIAYLNSLCREDRDTAIHRLVQFDLPCIIITNKNTVFDPDGQPRIPARQTSPVFAPPHLLHCDRPLWLTEPAAAGNEYRLPGSCV